MIIIIIIIMMMMMMMMIIIHINVRLLVEARCSSVVRAFAHGAMGRLINPS